MKTFEQTISELEDRAIEKFNTLKKGHRKEWYSIISTIKVLRVINNYSNYALTSNLPGFPSNEGDFELPCLSDVENKYSLLANYFIKIFNSGIKYYACLLDNGDDEGGNFGVLYFYNETDDCITNPDEDILTNMYKNPHKSFLGMEINNPPYYVSIHTL